MYRTVHHLSGPGDHPPVTVCWSLKGGSGTSVVAAALALTSPVPVTLVDLAGDLPAVLGLPEPHGPGLHEWLGSDAPAARLADLSVRAADHLTLVPSGQPGPVDRLDRWDEMVDALTSDGGSVIVDAGTGSPPEALHRLADRSLLVTRACYLALRRAMNAPVRPTGVVLVAEPGRALRSSDVEGAIGAPVLCTIAVDPAVARAVDAGLLASRIPRLMERDLRRIAA